MAVASVELPPGERRVTGPSQVRHGTEEQEGAGLTWKTGVWLGATEGVSAAPGHSGGPGFVTPVGPKISPPDGSQSGTCPGSLINNLLLVSHLTRE